MDGLLAAPYSEFQKKLEQEKRDKAEDKRIALLRPLLPALLHPERSELFSPIIYPRRWSCP